MNNNDTIRDKLIDIILKVAMKHHDDVSKEDEDAACDAADEILKGIEDRVFYFITTKRDKNNDFDNRCVGFYVTIEGARKNIIGNAESLCEVGYYRYAIIEAFGPGWYPHAEIEEWYEFSDDGKEVQKIEKPKEYEQMCNFGIG